MKSTSEILSFYKKQTIRFRRWSRKRCAVFCSLGRVVSIGCVKKGIVEASLRKQRGVIVSDACVWKEGDPVREEEDSGGWTDALWDMNFASLQPQTVVEGQQYDTDYLIEKKSNGEGDADGVFYLYAPFYV